MFFYVKTNTYYKKKAEDKHKIDVVKWKTERNAFIANIKSAVLADFIFKVLIYGNNDDSREEVCYFNKRLK